MAQINVTNLTFGYEGSFDNIFDNISFSIDTDWKLGFIGRNGKGKTTFLNLLLGKYKYEGSIQTSTVFDYFPYQIPSKFLKECIADFLEQLKPNCELWRVLCEMEKLQLDAQVLYRPFQTLSHGERTKVMLAILFSGENDFLLIDEPTNHLDQDSREIVKEYLNKKKSFILVSHDRDLLDACVDHVLVLNRHSIEVQTGNFSSWWENKRRKDIYMQTENEKHKKSIEQLRKTSMRSRTWAEKNENTKIGFNPSKEHDRNISTRSYIGAKTKKMQSRVKQFEKRIEKEIEEKEGLLQDIENPIELKMNVLEHHKEMWIRASQYGMSYIETGKNVFQKFDFTLHQGERIFIHGKNGCGKSSFLKAVLMHYSSEFEGEPEQNLIAEEGTLAMASGLVISYVSQDTSFLKGSIKKYCENRNLDISLFCAILRQLDMDRVQFTKNMEEYSEGQKKKVLIAASLLTPAHLYIWDEPLNYIDVFSRMQIEKVLLEYQPTMLVVEHDKHFREKIATHVVEI